jgi:hypothetical protein
LQPRAFLLLPLALLRDLSGELLPEDLAAGEAAIGHESKLPEVCPPSKVNTIFLAFLALVFFD